MSKKPNSGSKYYKKQAKANRQNSTQVQSNLPKSDSVKESDITVTNPNLENTNTESLSQSQATPNNKPQSSPRDLDRSRASAAWENIKQVKSTDTEYGSLARELPTMIQVNGLAQTLSFLKAKKKTHHLLIFDHLSLWICRYLGFENGDLLENVIRIESQKYRRATSESLAFLQWLKRFAEAKIDKQEDKQNP